MDTEDLVFKKLQGMSFNEVSDIISETIMSMSQQKADGRLLATDVMAMVDPVLIPYGWSYIKYIEHDADYPR